MLVSLNAHLPGGMAGSIVRIHLSNPVPHGSEQFSTFVHSEITQSLPVGLAVGRGVGSVGIGVGLDVGPCVVGLGVGLDVGLLTKSTSSSAA